MEGEIGREGVREGGSEEGIPLPGLPFTHPFEVTKYDILQYISQLVNSMILQ